MLLGTWVARWRGGEGGVGGGEERGGRREVRVKRARNKAKNEQWAEAKKVVWVVWGRALLGMWVRLGQARGYTASCGW